MKICFYCNSIFSVGGVQRVLAVIAKSLSQKHDITILTQDDPASEDTSLYKLNESDIRYQYISYARLPLKEYLPCKTYSFLYKNILPQTAKATQRYGYSSFPDSHRKKLIRFINDGEYDIVVGVHVFLSFQLASIRNEIKAHTIGWMHNSYDAFFNIDKPYIKGQENRFKHQMPLLDGLIVLSECDKKAFKEKLNVDSISIYNPLTIIPKGKGSPDNKKFLAVGRFSPKHKGFDILINAFALFARYNQDWTLDIVGEGPEEPFFRSLITQHHMEKRITIHPFTKNVQKHYASASIYVLSSRWEGFGLVLLEAMATALPIIASDVPVALELLQNKEFAVFFENGNEEDLAQKMQYLSSQDGLADLGEKARVYTDKFSLEAITEQWNNMLQVVKSKPESK